MKEEIEEYIVESDKEKHKQYLKYLQELIDTVNIDYPLEQAFQEFTNFIDNSTFNIIFTQWKPSDEDIRKGWDKFLNCYMKNVVDI